MVHGFEGDTPVLWMDPQVPVSAVADKTILWPAWAYTVIAPRVTSRPDDRLDVFQEAVLRLLRANVRDQAEAATVLHLDRRLVAYIRTGLRDMHLCDDRGEPTARGLRALRDMDVDDAEPCLGYVFQEPASRALWGRFVEQLTFKDVEWRGDQPFLRLGSAGSPRDVKALAIRPPSAASPVTPRAAEILEAVRRHRRAAANGSDGPALGSVAGATPENIQRISVVSEDPIPMWLGTKLYATDIEDAAAAWDVADPFGLGNAPQLRAQIARRTSDKSRLAELLRKLIKPERGDDRRDARAARVELAQMDLQECFGAALATARDLEALLVDFLVGVDIAADEDRPVGRADAAVRAQRALEGLLHHTFAPGSDEALAVDLIDDHDYDAAIFDARATAIGFKPLPRGMRYVSAHKVRAALRREVGSLRPLALANLLSAAAHPEHVFHEAAKQRASLFDDLDAIARVRDRSAHAGNEPPTQDEIEVLADLVLDIVGCLFEQPGAATAGVARG